MRRTSENAGIENLIRQITDLKSELEQSGLSESLRGSKKGTLEDLEARYRAHQDRIAALEEIGSDLSRIEAQFDLAREKASMKSRPGDMSFSLDFASRTLLSDESSFGKSSQLVSYLEEAFETEAGEFSG